MANLKPILSSQFLVTVDGIQGYWTKVSSPKDNRAEVKYNDGQTGFTRTLLGFVTREKVTLSKPYDPAADRALITWYKEKMANGASQPFVVTIQTVNADTQATPLAGAPTIILTQCQLASFKYPEVDRDSTKLAMIEMEVYHDDITAQ